METKANNPSFQSLFAHPSITKYNAYSRAVFANISSCHTAQKGFHLYQCDNTQCSHNKYQFHCCGNRHCPFCGSMKREAWIEHRTNELLPTPYYHVVFTLPSELHSIILGNRKLLFDTLFDTALKTLLQHGQNKEFLGAEPAITMVLHTWGQDLSFHPHVHCIVSGGGYHDGSWIAAKRKNNKFLFPEKSLASMYKAKFMEVLETNKAIQWGATDPLRTLKAISHKQWVVYAKAPFGGPAQVIEYLGRYTHKIAITKHRIEEVTSCSIKFKYKDYADGNQTKSMVMSHEEFLRRFELHILPARFVKIRHGGFLRNRDKLQRIKDIRATLHLTAMPARVAIPVAIRMLEKYGKDISKCSCCGTGKLVLLHDTRAVRREKQRPFPKPEVA